ncbi:MAG: hypothetical protein KAT85_09190, partial [candidate division Zixibacteria bacterium]|nr:hypothetical protein [candidate division Zixibacteria bacterium]
FGAGKAHMLETTISGGVVGVILDGRGRPFTPPDEDTLRLAKLKEWIRELDVYSEEALDRG